MTLDHLTKFPFNLDAAALAWVKASFEKLTPDEKISQLFNLRSQGNDPAFCTATAMNRPNGSSRPPMRSMTKPFGNVGETSNQSKRTPHRRHSTVRKMLALPPTRITSDALPGRGANDRLPSLAAIGEYRP